MFSFLNPPSFLFFFFHAVAKLPFTTFALKFQTWVVVQILGALASATLDVESFILEAKLKVDQVYMWAHQSGFSAFFFSCNFARTCIRGPPSG